ncbi:MAG: alpha-amylase family glycosyl hydrolase [Pseudomonadota bacterium]
MRIYNLFPLLAGPLSDWTPHLERAADLNFDWIYVNPIQQAGRSGSLYSIADYFSIDKRFRKPHSRRAPEDQVRDLTTAAANLGLRVSTDLVINHCAVDSPLVREHPEWFKRNGNKVANPFCVEEDGSRTVWRDLAQFDHEHTSDPEGLLDYCCKVVEYLVDLGFQGLRCDAAYQLPTPFWRRLIERTKSNHPDAVFLAETLGCSPTQTRDTASAGFDYLFNSSKWWDFSSPWLLEQYELTRDIAPSISFPESHDTERLYVESGNNVEALKQRYLFAALFSSGVMMPIGYEFGFQRRLHVVETSPEHWEPASIDLSDFIRHVNSIKAEYPVFQEESLLQRLDHPNPSLLLLWKASTNGKGQALLIFNKDPWNSQHFHCDDLYRHIQAPPPLLDVSPEWPMDHLPTPFEFELGPGMGRVLVTGSN